MVCASVIGAGIFRRDDEQLFGIAPGRRIVARIELGGDQIERMPGLAPSGYQGIGFGEQANLFLRVDGAVGFGV